MSNVAVIIQARMGSTRLPGKVLMDLEGKTVLERVVERAKKAGVGKVIVATSTQSEDTEIVGLCRKRGIPYYRGPLENVLGRYYHCASNAGAEQIVRITADCPLIDPDLIEHVVDLHLNENPKGYTASRIDPTAFPDGMDVEVFSYQALADAFHCTSYLWDIEHVTPYIKRKNNCLQYPSLVKFSEDVRFSLDTREDYDLILKIYRQCSGLDSGFGINEILHALEDRLRLEVSWK